MALDKKKVNELFEIIDSYEATAKETKSSIKEEFETFAKANDVDAKYIKKAYKAYKEYMKNKDEFEMADIEVTKIITLLTVEDVVNPISGVVVQNNTFNDED